MEQYIEKNGIPYKLGEQYLDPKPIDRFRHCVDTVIKAGEEPRQRQSIRAQLASHQRQMETDYNHEERTSDTR